MAVIVNWDGEPQKAEGSQAARPRLVAPPRTANIDAASKTAAAGVAPKRKGRWWIWVIVAAAPAVAAGIWIWLRF